MLLSVASNEYSAYIDSKVLPTGLRFDKKDEFMQSVQED